MRIHTFKYTWLILAVLAMVLRWALRHSPEWIEQYYSRGLFVGVRYVCSGLTWLSPIPLMYVCIGALVFFLFKKIRHIHQMSIGLFQKIKKITLYFIQLISALVFLFLVLWGYNYQRIPIEKQLALQPHALNLQELKSELEWLTPLLIEKKIASKNFTILTKKQLQQQIEQAVFSFLEQHDLQTYPQAQSRFLQPKGVLLYNGTAGVYFPWVGEANIDAGLHPLSQPYVLAHELGHAYGWGDEGTCNFIAYRACVDSKNPWISYCGMLGYWRTVASNYLQYEPQKYATFRASLPPDIIADLDAINKTSAQYPDWFPSLRHHTYDAFLKAQGISDGIANYNRVLMLGYAWRQQKNHVLGQEINK